jgi:hypothetical protein
LIAERAKKVLSPFGLFSEVSMFPAVPSLRPDPEFDDQVARLRLEAEKLSELRKAVAEHAAASTGLYGLGTPQGIRGAFGALAYMAGVSVVFPLSLLAIRPVPSAAWWRVAVVAAFVSGVGTVGVVLWRGITESPPTD